MTILLNLEHCCFQEVSAMVQHWEWAQFSRHKHSHFTMWCTRESMATQHMQHMQSTCRIMCTHSRGSLLVCIGTNLYMSVQVRRQVSGIRQRETRAMSSQSFHGIALLANCHTTMRISRQERNSSSMKVLTRQRTWNWRWLMLTAISLTISRENSPWN